MATVAEWFLRGLIEQGCDAIFINPGTDTPPLQEAWARLKQEGVAVPKLVLCPHEIVAVTAAQGYYLATGRAQVAFVHVDVGTANATGGLNDARASRIPLVLCAGMSPLSLDTTVPGARAKFINWLQDVPDQGALVRNYVKWQQVVAHASAVGLAVDRAFQMANSEPEGPVYLAFPRETLMEETPKQLQLGRMRSRPVRLPGLDEEAAEALVRRLLEAEFPLLVTGYGGRTRAHRDAIVAFAEVLNLPITEYRGRFNASLEHPLHLGFNPERWVGEADAILVLDHDVPFVPADRPLRDDLHITHMGPDPIQQNLVTWGFPADEVLACNTLAGLRSLMKAADRILPSLSTEARQRLETRKRSTAERHNSLMQALEAREASPGTNAITPFMVGRALSKLCPDAQLYEEAVTSGNPLALGFRPSEEGSYMRNGGSFLGWGLGASLGAKLADPEKTVVCVTGDGSFMFGVPSAALWMAKTQGIAVLFVIVNNACYNSVRLATRDSFPEGIQATEGYVGVDLTDPPAFEKIAEACGAWGGRVETHDQLEPVLAAALEAVNGGVSAVVNITIQASEKPL
ncbi:thiamine pyrophosphate-requiring protein [Martelella limonii]|uniref:thiamine pyrophosphate-requiring protein n=1 Tax=Martelella limonii TaxID=1647649 RepID=UPI0015800D29|nr:thiamine pyrophosphate-requiring protein [Martelella limonii]